VPCCLQDSTHLWEMLPAKVMDAAVKEHQQVIRRKMQQHFGYESATEGDSFIIAFHTPQDALRFSIDMQVRGPAAGAASAACLDCAYACCKALPLLCGSRCSGQCGGWKPRGR
jgi:class 3 adenylate cyclase